MTRTTRRHFLITSDHGYNLGQHRLPSNKFLLCAGRAPPANAPADPAKENEPARR